MCDGSMTSMLPVVTTRVFGIERGGQVYGYMYSVFGVAAILGTVLVKTVQEDIGYHGMLIVALAFTLVSVIIAIFYKFNKIDFSKWQEEK